MATCPADAPTPAEAVLTDHGYSRASHDLNSKETNEGPRPVYERFAANYQKAVVWTRWVHLYRMDGTFMEDSKVVMTDKGVKDLKTELKRRVKK